MNKRKIAAGLVASLIAIAPSMVLAEDCCMPEYRPGDPLCDPCVGYSQYAGVQLDCGFDVYAWGEFLYWKPYRVTTYLGVEVPANTLTDPLFERTQKLGYRPGFRVGIGMVAHDFDDWMFNADYTWYHHAFSKTMSVTAPYTLQSPLLIFIGVPFSSIRNKSHYHYDVVGVNIQRPNYLGQNVILSPFLGLKWLKKNSFIAQDLTLATGPFAGRVNHAHGNINYTSIGIAAGFDGSWLLCWGLSLIGKIDVAILYPYERTISEVLTPANITPQNALTRYKHHIRHMDLYGKGGMGIGWGSYFCCNRYHVNLAATWDWMGDVVALDFASGMFSGNGSTILMGLTVHGQFDF